MSLKFFKGGFKLFIPNHFDHLFTVRYLRKIKINTGWRHIFQDCYLIGL